MKRFLTALRQSDAFVVRTCTDPTPHLREGALASPYYGAFDGAPPTLNSYGHVVFVFPKSAKTTLRALETNWTQDDRRSVFVTHGHASVGVMTADGDVASRAMDLAAQTEDGFEHWRLSDGILQAGEKTVVAPPERVSLEHDFDIPDLLPYAGATQLRQLRSNLAQLCSTASFYIPEMAATIDDLVAHGQTSAEQLLELAGRDDLLSVQERHHVIGGLVELNAGLSMVLAQAGLGTAPLLSPNSAVAEYSLLGVGQAWRGLFALYRHLRLVFAEADHLTVLDSLLRGGHRLDPLVERRTWEYHEWYGSDARISRASRIGINPEWRSHAVYFSSRQGFHETYATMSGAWQTVHASASREWSLLTLSHEFVHAHVRDLVACILDGADFGELSRNWKVEGELPVKLSMQLIILSSLRYVSLTRARLDAVNLLQGGVLDIDGWDEVPSPALLERLAQGRSRRYAHEIFVHVLDYLYTYGGSDEEYISAVWGSWSHVPAVSRRIHHYTLRTLCALASNRDELLPPSRAFVEAETRLVPHLEALAAIESAGQPVIRAALENILSEVGRKKLQVEFAHAFPLAIFSRYFLYDGKAITARLAHDPDEVVDEDAGRYLDLTVGSFLGAFSNPTALLLTERRTYSPTAGQDTESRSLWQLLELSP